MNSAMFENLSVEHAERKSAPRTVEVPPEIAKLISQAWDFQQDPENSDDTGHFVRLTSKEEVDVFHKFARAAASQNETPLKYRRLTRVGADKSEKTAYFSLRKVEAEDAEESETPAPVKSRARKPAAK